MELAVIAAAALFMAEYMVSLIQLYKAAVQGWVPRVSVRVKLGGAGLPLSLFPCPFPGPILITSTHKDSMALRGPVWVVPAPSPLDWLAPQASIKKTPALSPLLSLASTSSPLLSP